MLVLNLDYSDYVGRLAIGRIVNGTLKRASRTSRSCAHGRHASTKARVTYLYAFEGLERVEVDGGRARATSSRSPASTRCTSATPSPIPNDPRRAAARHGRRADGEHDVLDQQLAVRRAGGQVRHVAQPQGAARARDPDERQHSASSRARPPDAFKVSGRGELQMAILIEMMRREGFELAVSKPEVITRDDRRRAARADGAAGHRLPRGLRRRRHAEDRRAARAA